MNFISSKLASIYGAGKFDNPDICLIFMNPTAKNISAYPEWSGLRAPWLGTKNVWKLLFKLGFFKNSEMLEQINSMKPEDWTSEFSNDLYSEIANESIYITNIAKCTQDDARVLPDSVYKAYLPLMLEELGCIKPKLVIAMGNQVNSVLLSKPISVSKYLGNEFEELEISNDYKVKVYPTYYPIGQGTPNMPKAVERIRNILS